MAQIPILQEIDVQPVKLNTRLWELHRKCADRSATPAELSELEMMCRALESTQDNGEPWE